MIPQLLNSLFMHPVYGLKSPDLAETMSELALAPSLVSKLAQSQRRKPRAGQP